MIKLSIFSKPALEIRVILDNASLEKLNLRKYNCNRASAIVQYALVIGLAALAFSGMQLYLKRGLQGEVKSLTDEYIGKKQSKSLDKKEEGPSKSESESKAESKSSRAEGGARSIETKDKTTSKKTSEANDTSEDKPDVPYFASAESGLMELPVFGEGGSGGSTW